MTNRRRLLVTGFIALLLAASLVVGIVWLGLYPAPVLRRTEPAARRYLEAVAPHGAWQPTTTLGGTAGVAEDRR